MAPGDPPGSAPAGSEQAEPSRGEVWRTALWPIPRAFGWYRDNAAAGTLVVAAFLIVKGYVIARGDLSTALGILQYAGLTSVVVAGLLSSLPILAALMLALAVYRLAKAIAASSAHGEHSAEYNPGSRGPMAVVMACAFLLTAVFTQWPYMVAAIALGALAGTLEGWRPSGTPFARVAVGAFAAYGVIAMLYTAWLPHEEIVLKPTAAVSAPKPRVGYVLADDPGGWLTMLSSEGHTIARFRDSAIKSEAVCRHKPRGALSDVFYASTLWTASAPLLVHLHLGHFSPGVYKPCPD
jgi:hypothetical protein